MWESRDAFSSSAARRSADRLGMGLFLLSLAILFAASVLGYIAVRVRLTIEGNWPADLPPLPGAMVLSTAVLVACSIAAHRAMRSARDDANDRALRAINVLFALGVGFLLMQSWCWWTWFGRIADGWESSDSHRFALTGYFVLTGIHAAHVVGGLLSIIWMMIRLRRGGPCAGGVALVASYWHFLDAVWLALWAVLLVTGT